MVNRYTGEVLYETQIQGARAPAPRWHKRCYVPTVTGLVLAYRVEPLTDPMRELGILAKKDPTPEEKKALEEERRQNIRINQEYVPPFANQSSGRTLVPPTVTFQDRNEEFCAWGTDRGYLNIGRIDRSGEDGLMLKHTIKTGQAILAPPSYLPPDPKVTGDSGVIYVASCDGYVYAVLEKSGELLWKFSAGEPVVESAVVIGDRVFAPTELGGMYCLDAKSGRQLWWSPDIRRFLAAGKQRVYAFEQVGRVRILDGKTGAVLDSLPTESLPLGLTNTQTDRLYVGTDTGMLECMHDVEQVKPILYREPPPEEAAPKPKTKTPGETPEKKPAARPKAPPAAAKPKVARRRRTTTPSAPTMPPRPTTSPRKAPAKKAAKGKALEKGKAAKGGQDAFGGDNGGF